MSHYSTDDESEEEILEDVRENIVSRLKNLARWDTMTNEMEPEDHIAWIAADIIEGLRKDNQLLQAKVDEVEKIGVSLKRLVKEALQEHMPGGR